MLGLCTHFAPTQAICEGFAEYHLLLFLSFYFYHLVPLISDTS